MEQLLTLNRYDELVELLSGDKQSTQGIKDIEVQHLSWLGFHLPYGKDLVEVGSHKGKSICCMGSGALQAGNTASRLFAIDLWTKGKTNYAHQRSEETWLSFNEQVMQMGLVVMVRPIMMSSLSAAMRRKKPIHLMFVDGSHKYQDVHADYMAWHKFIPSGGRIAFHDYKSRFQGVAKTIDETVIPSGLWKDYHVYGSIWSATRV